MQRATIQIAIQSNEKAILIYLPTPELLSAMNSMIVM